MRAGPAVRTPGSDPGDDGSIPSPSTDRESPNQDGHRALNADDAGSTPVSRARILTLKKIDAALKAWMDGPYGQSLRAAYGTTGLEHPIFGRIQPRTVVDHDSGDEQDPNVHRQCRSEATQAHLATCKERQ